MGVQQDMAEGPWESETQSNPWFIGVQRWNKVEEVAEGIISKFRPTVVAEQRRDSVIKYIQRLLKDNLDCEVFAYGSVPLKTYLPDGDIDLTAVGAITHDLIKEIASLLESEGKNSSAEFVVKDVQLIGAEVKLVKCMVQNLVVDISVNQIGGLCTLCFLEKVDREIKKDHLFKRSVILIKAWCYFESRTLGAHVGLISTYGLETLVLYIFHVFHLSLDGPLSVLYKFLEYFSTFDWDHYGISLMGPVRLSELPRIIGNFFRIRSAFGYGARKLGQILMAPEDNLTEELHAFFSNTLNMHGMGQRPDLPDHIPRSSLNVAISSSGTEKTFTSSDAGKLRSSNDENSYMGSRFLGNRISIEGKDVSALESRTNGEVNKNPVQIPFYAPHLLFHYSKLVNKTENGDTVDALPWSEEVPCAIGEVTDDGNEGKDLDPSELLDLSGDLTSHVACLEHVRWWNAFVFAPAAMMGPIPPPPPPPPPILLSMIASEHGGMNGVVRHPQFQPSDQMFMCQPPFAHNDPNARGTMTYFSDMNQSLHGYQTSMPNTTINGTPSPTEGVSAFSPVNQPTPQREPLSHRRRRQNPNRAPRPRSVSGTLYNLHTI